MNVTTREAPSCAWDRGFFEVPGFTVYPKVCSLLYILVNLNVREEHDYYYIRVGYYGRNSG